MTPKTKTILGWASAFALLALLVLGVRACFSARESAIDPAAESVHQTRKQNEKDAKFYADSLARAGKLDSLYRAIRARRRTTGL